MNDYRGDVVPGGAERRARAGGPGDPQGQRRHPGQQRLPADLPGHRRQLLVDAADDAHRLRALLAEGTGGLDVIVTTHQHWDHHRALAELAGSASVTAAGAEDADALPVPPDRRLRHGDHVELGDVRLEVIALRGHTPGSVALLYSDPVGRPHLFTGDSLFPGGPGRTTSPKDFTSLMDDLESRVFARLPDDTWVYPGHGKDTTLGAERPHLAEWRARGW